MNIIGIYAVLHVPTGSAYVGGSVNVLNRFTWHRVMLRTNRHSCQEFQYFWNKTQEIDWITVVLEHCGGPQNLKEREFWWHHNWPSEVFGRPVSGYRHSIETKKSMSKSAIRIAAPPDERKKRSERATQQHIVGKFGRCTWNANSEKIFQEKMKGKNKGAKRSEETRAKQRAAWSPKRRKEQSDRITKLNAQRGRR